jgi:tRNA-2-methylthio-N6-dimethylallyladenosine synthase
LITKFQEKEPLFDEQDERYVKAWKTAVDKLIKANIPFEIKKERLKILNELVNKYALESNKKTVDTIIPVLIEGESEKNSNMLMGYTDTFKLVNIEGDKKYIGKIVNVKIVQAKTWSLNGTIIE